MRKITHIVIIILATLTIVSCGPHMYKTQSGGKENVSYIIVLKESGDYKNVSVVVDKETYPYEKVYKVKAKRKAHPIIIEPGTHHIQVKVDETIVTDEKVFLGLQETKTIVLR